MVIAADNDRAMEGQEVGRNPGLIKGQQAAEGAGAVLMAPSFSEEEVQAGFTDWNDMASHDEVRAALVAKELENALVKALERARHRDPALDVDGNTELENASEREDEEPSADQNTSSGVTMQNEQEIFFSLGKNGVIEHIRTADGRFVVREGGEKPRILNEDHQGATPEKNIAGNTATLEEARVDSGRGRTRARLGAVVRGSAEGTEACSATRERSSFSVGFPDRQNWRDRTFPELGWSCRGS